MATKQKINAKNTAFCSKRQTAEAFINQGSAFIDY